MEHEVTYCQDCIHVRGIHLVHGYKRNTCLRNPPDAGTEWYADEEIDCDFYEEKFVYKMAQLKYYNPM